MNDLRKISLSLEKLEVGFGTPGSGKILMPALNEIAREGELIAVLGRNGIGKSTLLRTITGLHPIVSGDLYIDGRNLKEYSRIQLSEKVGYISTEIVKVNNMTVFDLVSMGRFPYTGWFGQIRESDKREIISSIERVGLVDFINRPVIQLSDGERQKAMIAMVLAQDTGLIVMDEPTAFLDISAKLEIMHILHDLALKRNKTIIFSTHDLEFALNQADRIWLLSKQGILSGAPEDLMLQGAFGSLFDPTKVTFNPMDGTFRIKNTRGGELQVIGKGHEKYWTEKALERAGYVIVESGATVVVEVQQRDGLKWFIKNELLTRWFNSLYELVYFLKQRKSNE